MTDRQCVAVQLVPPDDRVDRLRIDTVFFQDLCHTFLDSDRGILLFDPTGITWSKFCPILWDAKIEECLATSLFGPDEERKGWTVHHIVTFDSGFHKRCSRNADNPGGAVDDMDIDSMA